MHKALLIAIVCMLTAPLSAEVLVGKPAPPFKVSGDCVNEPDFKTLAECKGEVVLICDWHVRDLPSQKLAKVVQGLWDKYHNKGLHIYMAHRLNMERIDPVTDYCVKNKLMFCAPICAFGEANDFDAYLVKDKMNITVIGMDGNVLYYNTSGGWQAVLEGELKKIVYPQLLRQSVTKALEPTARAFGEGAWGKAIAMANAALAGELDDSGKDDARHIIKRAEEIAQRKLKRIERDKDRRHYVEVFAGLEEMQKAFKESEFAVNAEKEAKRLKDDKKVKDELKAQESLNYVMDQNRSKGKAQRVNVLRVFAKNFAGTRAAEDAAEIANRLETAEY